MVKSVLKYITIAFKGVCMGAADIVPGVSGGTIALLMGIYNELIDSIKSVNGKALKLLFKGDVKALWKHVNGAFLLSLISGILISILALSGVMKYTLENHPIELWSFFFGLIVTSSVVFFKGLGKLTFSNLICSIVGVAIASYICLATPSSTPETYFFIFVSGMIAICAMILPGISGSFILLLLGKYEFVMDSIISMNIPVLLTFAGGAIIGILSFSHLLGWLLKRFYTPTIALLAGFMIGSLLKVWPWKETHGVTDIPILPHQYAEITGNPSLVLQAVVCALIGVGVVMLIEVFSSKHSNR